MRIAHFVRHFCNRTLTFIYNEIKNLSQNEHIEIDVITLNRINENEFPFPDVYNISEYRDETIGYKVKWRLYKWNIYLNYYKKEISDQIANYINDRKPDIIHAHFGTDALIFWDNLNKNLEIPFFVHFHGYDASSALKISRIYKNRIHNLFMKPKVHPIFVSENMYRSVIDQGLLPDKKRILYYGIDLSKFKRKNYNSTKKTFLQVASFREKKGHIYTIEAFSRFLCEVDNPSEFKLILAGGGPLLEEMKAYVKLKGISSNVKFVGWVNHREAKELMENASFFVHHSITGRDGDKEGIPNALIEAMAMELPIISTLHSGIPELVENNVNGYLTVEKDVHGITDALFKIIYWDYCPQNRIKAEKIFDQKIHSYRLNDFYNKEI